MTVISVGRTRRSVMFLKLDTIPLGQLMVSYKSVRLQK